MGGNSFGTVFRVTTFGESHGPALGCVVDGCPAGLSLSREDVARELRRRRPGTGGPAVSARNEADEPEILSGVFEGKTLGSPIAILVKNEDQRSADYEAVKNLYRPGHADWTWEAKYGFRDYRGGGRSSGRETLGRVAAGAVAKALLAVYGIEVRAWVSRAAGIDAASPGDPGFDLDEAEKNPLRMPDKASAERAGKKLEEIAGKKDSAGGLVSCRISGLPPGLGEPVFGKIGARLGKAVLSIGACKGIEFGAGFASSDALGSENNDTPLLPPPDIADGGANAGPAFAANRAGGSLGGISTGMELSFRAAFKPAASIGAKQAAINREGKAETLEVRGRHDVCIAPRAVPVVEAMAALVIADLLLLRRCSRI